MDEEWRYYTGDAIFTTDRLIELHGGERINPESNLDFYVREAVQTAYDSLRLAELSDEVEAPQMILCDAWKLPSGEIPEAANAYWYALLTPGIQPQESLLSQGTYHLKEISRNGNRVQIVVCHPTLGSRYIAVWWRDAGYRAEATGSLEQIGCQAAFEADDYISEHEEEPSFTFSFGERVFSASDMLKFPRRARRWRACQHARPQSRFQVVKQNRASCCRSASSICCIKANRVKACLCLQQGFAQCLQHETRAEVVPVLMTMPFFFLLSLRCSLILL